MGNIDTRCANPSFIKTTLFPKQLKAKSTTVSTVIVVRYNYNSITRSIVLYA